MTVIKRVGVLSVAKVQAIIMAVFGLIVGVIYAFAGAVFGAMMGSAGLGAGLGFAAIIILPIFYAVIGFISGAIGAWLYNLVANWIGGVELDLEK